MKHFKKGLLAAAALLVLSAVTASAAAAPYASSSTAAHIKHPADANAQLKIIAEAEPLWKDEFVARWDEGQTPQPHLLNYDSTQTRFAVTDLDGNGRLELLFRHVAFPKGRKGTIPYPFLRIPTAAAIAIYEVGADGRLTRLPVPEDGYGAPDFMGLDASHPIPEDGVLWYPMCTQQMDRDDHGHFHYTTTYRRIAIKDGRVKIHVLAEESGYYNVYDIDRVEQVATSASIYDGNPIHEKMRPEDFWQTAFYQKFHQNYAPNSVAHWISGSELNVDPRKALLASWQGFVYRSMNGKG